MKLLVTIIMIISYLTLINKGLNMTVGEDTAAVLILSTIMFLAYVYRVLVKSGE